MMRNLGIVVAIVTSLASLAHANKESHPPKTRTGLFVGLHFGVGMVQFDGLSGDTINGGAGGIYAGWHVSPALVVGYDGFGVLHLGRGSDFIHYGTDSVAAQYWLSPRWWTRVGIGLGRSYYAGPALAAVVGFETWQSELPYSVDLQLRSTMIKTDNGTVPGASLTIGVNWY